MFYTVKFYKGEEVTESFFYAEDPITALERATSYKEMNGYDKVELSAYNEALSK